MLWRKTCTFTPITVEIIHLYLREWCWTEFLQVCWSNHGADGLRRWWSRVWWPEWRGCWSSGCLRTFSIRFKSNTFQRCAFKPKPQSRHQQHNSQSCLSNVLLARQEAVILLATQFQICLPSPLFFFLNQICLHAKIQNKYYRFISSHPRAHTYKLAKKRLSWTTTFSLTPSHTRAHTHKPHTHHATTLGRVGKGYLKQRPWRFRGALIMRHWSVRAWREM